MEAHKISIAIPTAGRRQGLLQRAITSAFIGDESIFTEIIVVANGSAAEHFSLPKGILPPDNASIRVIRTGEGNVSHARNLAIAAATGQWLRFLDDDDFLIPEAARRQYLEAVQLSCDVSTYAGAIQDSDGHTFQIIRPDGAKGYACAVLGPSCPALTFASVYRTEKICGLSWNENWSAAEDEDWMRRILQSGSPKWIFGDEVVGVWYQHPLSRLSRPLSFNALYLNRALSIFETVEVLKKQCRLGRIEKESAAEGLWSAVHGGFSFSPFHWSRVGLLARRMDSSSRPKDKIFSLFSWVHPLIIEWIFLPKRVVNHAVRVVKGKYSGFGAVRKIL